MVKKTKKKEKSPTWYRKKAVELAKLIAKHRDGYECVNPQCGRSSKNGFQMHGSHILPEGRFHRMSVEPENIMCQCAVCHMNWHEHPLGQDWFHKTFPGRKDKLMIIDKAFSLDYMKPDYKKILESLKKTYFKMIN